MNKLLTELWRKTARHFHLEMEWKHNHCHKVKEKIEVSKGESALLCASVLRSLQSAWTAYAQYAYRDTWLKRVGSIAM